MVSCPFCNCNDTQVKDSRASEEGASIRRRRSCPECKGRFTTFERVQIRPIMVIKQSGNRVLFDREKLSRSVLIATRKRPISAEQVDIIVSRIIHKLESCYDSDITSQLIGELTLNELKKIDKIAYIRFMSVYKSFSNTEDFVQIIQEMS